MTNEQYYDFIQPYHNANEIMRMKLEVLNHNLYLKSSQPIHHIQVRVKEKRSIEEKLARMNYSDSVQNAKDHLLDVAGIRVICYFVDDIHNLVNALNGALNGAFGLALPTDVAYIEFLGTQGAVVLGMVYNFLPFMILPIFSVIEKIDPRVIEAAQDLGANSQQVFRKVIFPLSLPGVLSGVTMVFIPSVSTFVISRLLGGGTTILLGDLIEMQFLGNAYNPHLGSAISLVMMVIVLVCMGIMNRFGEGEGEAVLL